MKHLLLALLLATTILARSQCTYNYTTANFPANLNISAGETLCITQDVTSASGTINIYNGGTIIVNDGVTFTVDGTLNNFGKINLEGSAANLHINGSYNGNGYNDCDILRFCNSCNDVNINSAVPVDLGYFKTTASASWVDICAQIVLPVELTSFDCYSSKLQWSTATEINSDYFTIQHSYNSIDFTDIDYINAQGSSTEIVNYEYQVSRSGYYRLSQTDYDGTTETFDIVTCNDKNRIESEFLYYVNALGQIVTHNTKGLVLKVYSDGTTVKTIR